ncbi:hypothetical protein C2E23DRAFT_509083 [Lenzites betulinus]|nr:hypothetical protein C2E23DRAFT_509083 [Lenzites betulinus]
MGASVHLVHNCVDMTSSSWFRGDINVAGCKFRALLFMVSGTAAADIRALDGDRRRPRRARRVSGGEPLAVLDTGGPPSARAALLAFGTFSSCVPRVVPVIPANTLGQKLKPDTRSPTRTQIAIQSPRPGACGYTLAKHPLHCIRCGRRLAPLSPCPKLAPSARRPGAEQLDGRTAAARTAAPPSTRCEWQARSVFGCDDKDGRSPWPAGGRLPLGVSRATGRQTDAGNKAGSHKAARRARIAGPRVSSPGCMAC